MPESETWRWRLLNVLRRRLNPGESSQTCPDDRHAHRFLLADVLVEPEPERCPGPANAPNTPPREREAAAGGSGGQLKVLLLVGGKLSEVQQRVSEGNSTFPFLLCFFPKCAAHRIAGQIAPTLNSHDALHMNGDHE